MKFKQIACGSNEYEEELRLREKLLRKPLDLELRDQDLENEEKQYHFGIFEENKLLACLIAKPVDDKVVQLRQMAVLPEYQRKGIGKVLMEFTESELRNRDYNQIWLNARMEVERFYQNLGYETVGNEFMEVTIPHVKMEKAL